MSKSKKPSFLTADVEQEAEDGRDEGGGSRAVPAGPGGAGGQGGQGQEGQGQEGREGEWLLPGGPNLLQNCQVSTILEGLRLVLVIVFGGVR